MSTLAKLGVLLAGLTASGALPPHARVSHPRLQFLLDRAYFWQPGPHNPAAGADDYQQLMQRKLTAPLRGLAAGDIRDTFNQGRSGGTLHEATDILAPRGTPIVAVEDGIIQKLFLSKPGGLTIYEFDRQEIFCYYYAHLDHYAEGLREGMLVNRGDIIGYVGTTGNAPPETPHLHFTIFRLGPEKRWWQGTAIDPYPVLMKLVK